MPTLMCACQNYQSRKYEVCAPVLKRPGSVAHSSKAPSLAGPGPRNAHSSQTNHVRGLLILHIPPGHISLMNEGEPPEHRPVNEGIMEERADVCSYAYNGQNQGGCYLSQARASDGGLWLSWLLILDSAAGFLRSTTLDLTGF